MARSNSELSPDFNYRPEVDGLRAIAVFAVIIFHFSDSVLPGGFLGVDVFFVISGYVITRNLISRSDHELKSFLVGFYSRRIKRIVPALAFCVAVSSIFISLLSPIANDSLKAGLTALFGFSNLYFMNADANYFGNTSELNIFTQTWSLGVEEQFYLIYPMLFWVLFAVKNGCRVIQVRGVQVIATLVFASLVLYLVTNINYPIRAFYLVFCRFWELGIGCLIALKEPYLEDKIKGGGILQKLTAPAWMLIIVLASLLIPYSYLAITTVLVVLSSAILIISIDKQSIIYRFLTCRIVVYLGLISYSLYLWHWVVLVVSNWTVGVTGKTLPLQAVAIFAISSFSYHFVENPLRKKRWSKSQAKTISYGFGACIFSCIFILGIYASGGLYLGQNKAGYIEECGAGLASKNWIVGDSHAGIYSLLFADIFKGDCYFISDTDAAGNSFLFSRNVLSIQQSGSESNVLVEVELIDPSSFLDLIDFYKPEKLIIAVYWNGYFLENSSLHDSASWQIGAYKSPVGSRLERKGAVQDYLKNLRLVSESVRESTEIILFLPEPDFNWASYGVRSGECERQWFMAVDYPPPLEEICEYYLNPGIMTRLEHEQRTSELVTSIYEELGNQENIKFIDISSIICNQEYCSTHDENHRLYMDDDHLSSVGLEKIRPYLLEILEKSTP
jgi:peptidoglycan/LPS O-acetylase OafA/YrhL